MGIVNRQDIKWDRGRSSQHLYCIAGSIHSMITLGDLSIPWLLPELLWQAIRTETFLIARAETNAPLADFQSSQLLYCIAYFCNMIYVHMSYALPSYHFIILVSSTPVRAKITGCKIKDRDHCRTGRDHRNRPRLLRPRSLRPRSREWPRSPCSHWRLDGTGEYHILAQDQVNVDRPALPSSTTAHIHYRKCHYDYLAIH